MSSSSSPCGACKFLRRKCMEGCVFAPYFSHEQGATHFGSIHKVFGASNVSKLLSHLAVSDRCEAAVTIAYEAQARVQDPIYGCVSHIFALQQQVMYLQAQLASIKEQAAAQVFMRTTHQNPNNPKFYGESNCFHPLQNDFMQDDQGTNIPPFDSNMIANVTNVPFFASDLNPNSVKYENPGIQEQNSTTDSRHERPWPSEDDHTDDLESVALRYIRRNA